MRAYATFAVIVLHCASPVLYRYSNIPRDAWWTGHIFDSLVRFSVPIFFMLTGALLLNRDYELGDFLKKRFWRIIPPLFFWTALYVLYNVFITSDDIITPLNVLKKFVRGILRGSHYHLWFVYTLLGLYLFIPLLRKWVRQSTSREILFFLGIWLCTFLDKIPGVRTYLPNLELQNFAGYMGYLVLGYFLSKQQIKNKLLPVLCIAIGISVTIVGTYYQTVRADTFVSFFYEYQTFNVLLVAVGVFLWFKEMTIVNSAYQKVVNFISEHSFGVYLAHVLVLYGLQKLHISWEFIHPSIGIPLTAVLCLGISVLIIFLLRKVKYGNIISG